MSATATSDPIAARVGAWSRRRAARWLVARAVDLHVVGLELVPAAGPVILVARHYHHLYDAAAILACVPRQVHVLIALDWLGRGGRLQLMRWLAAQLYQVRATEPLPYLAGAACLLAAALAAAYLPARRAAAVDPVAALRQE